MILLLNINFVQQLIIPPPKIINPIIDEELECINIPSSNSTEKTVAKRKCFWSVIKNETQKKIIMNFLNKDYDLQSMLVIGGITGSKGTCQS